MNEKTASALACALVLLTQGVPAAVLLLATTQIVRMGMAG
jgi:hypothetical protein